MKPNSQAGAKRPGNPVQNQPSIRRLPVPPRNVVPPGNGNVSDRESPSQSESEPELVFSAYNEDLMRRQDGSFFLRPVTGRVERPLTHEETRSWFLNTVIPPALQPQFTASPIRLRPGQVTNSAHPPAAKPDRSAVRADREPKPSEDAAALFVKLYGFAVEHPFPVAMDRLFSLYELIERNPDFVRGSQHSSRRRRPPRRDLS